jgi:hypothetical protein
MSIHSNAFSDPAAHGTETFSFAEGTTGAALRNLVQAEMIAAWGLTNRGNKTANFFVLRETAMPAVLHELAFITNSTDVLKLKSATERQKAARAHLFAIQRHFGLARHVPVATLDDPDGSAVPDDEAPADESDESALDEEGGCAAGGSSGACGGLALLVAALVLGGARRRRSGR